MTAPTRRDRAMGAVIGSLIGDALGLGCHWYYDVEALQRDCGLWVDDYQDSDPEREDKFGYIARLRYEHGLRAGDTSQTGQIAVSLIESFAHCGGYSESDFTARLDDFFTTIGGSALSGRFTDRAVRETWEHRQAGTSWGVAGSSTDTAEAAIWNVVQAARSHGDMHALCIDTHRCANLTHNNPYITGYSTAFVLSVAALINGVGLDDIRTYLMGLRDDPEIEARTCSNDIMFQVGNEAARMGADPSLSLDPVVVCRLFGMNCTIGFMMPAAYFSIHRYPDNFANAVLTAVNAGGNNMARAALTGALSGAMLGLSGIPKRLISGLSDHDRLLELCEQIVE